MNTEEKAPPLENGEAKTVDAGASVHGGVGLGWRFPGERSDMGFVNRLYEKPRIWRTMGAIQGLAGIRQLDTIEYLDYFWLVAGWRVVRAARLRTPMRLIWLQPLPHQRMEKGSPFGDFVLNEPLPKDVWEGKRSGGWFVVAERPDIWFRIPRA